MNPYEYVALLTEPDDSLLSLCCGIGLEFERVKTKDITAVDIAPQYLDKLNQDHPDINTVCSDALEFVQNCDDGAYDVVAIIDGIEHMTKVAGLKLIEEMRRVCRKSILLFTPDGYLKNEPHNAWGIEGADEHQTHKSGWTLEELEGLGFDLLIKAAGTSQHGEPYIALMMEYKK